MLCSTRKPFCVLAPGFGSLHPIFRFDNGAKRPRSMIDFGRCYQYFIKGAEMLPRGVVRSFLTGEEQTMKVLYVTTISNTVNSFLIPHIELLIEQGCKVDIACNVVTEIDPRLLDMGCRVFNVTFQRSPFHKPCPL